MPPAGALGLRDGEDPCVAHPGIAVVRPVSTRLSRMEALLIEMRAEQDVKLKKINKLQRQFEELTETVRQKLIS